VEKLGKQLQRAMLAARGVDADGVELHRPITAMAGDDPPVLFDQDRRVEAKASMLRAMARICSGRTCADFWDWVSFGRAGAARNGRMRTTP
jgi:hypothetical protein